MAFSSLYRLVSRVFAFLRVHRMDSLSKDAEILVLRISWRCSGARLADLALAGPIGRLSCSSPG